jgi:hypothetical protein
MSGIHKQLGNASEPWRQPASQVQQREVTGYDTTGTRYATPGLTSQIVSGLTAGLAGIAGQWLPLIQYAFRVGARQSNFNAISFVASDSAAIQVRPQEDRTYFIVQNNSGAPMYIGIGYAPSPTTGLILPANGVYEPYQVPLNEIFILGTSNSGQNGVVLYATM